MVNFNAIGPAAFVVMLLYMLIKAPETQAFWLAFFFITIIAAFGVRNELDMRKV